MGKELSLIGQTFGAWTVLEKDESIKSPHTHWKCQCSCGTIKTLQRPSLINGRSQSCGKCKPKINFIDLKGQSVGEWKILYRDDSKPKNSSYWVCQCSCGAIRSIRSYRLRSGKIAPCTCKNRYFVGQIINGRRLLSYKKGSGFWTYQCLSCGFTSKIGGPESFNKHQCACKLRVDDATKIHVMYKCASKARKIKFDLDVDWFRQNIHRPCVYCGLSDTNTYNYKGRQIKYNGVDRVDSKIGYTASNVVPCCITCNKMKLSLSVPEFEEHILRIAKNIKKKRRSKNGNS